MLQELFIKNFAIIDDLRICFSEGLTILSGETGAGKSVIINAINLLLGSRASAKLIRTGAKSAEVEGFFHIGAESKNAKIIEKYGYDVAEGLLVRRIISKNSKHKIYINGNLATTNVLNSITRGLLNISGQHANQYFLKEGQHLLILDQFARVLLLRSKVYECYHKIAPLIKKLSILNKKKDQQKEHIELLEHQKKEITDTAIVFGEDETLKQEITRLKNKEFLFKTAYLSVDELYNANGAIIERLEYVSKNLEKACMIDNKLSKGTKTLTDAKFLIEEAVNDLLEYIKKIQIDNDQLEAMETRLYTLQTLKRKYGKTLEEVLLHLESITKELNECENITAEILNVTDEIVLLHKTIEGFVNKLSEKRKQAAKDLGKKVEKELASLKMSKTKFEIVLNKMVAGDNISPYLKTNNYAINESGIDNATFMIAPNIGEELKPLTSIASGGELSRVVLSLKSILAITESVGTVIFDEVDAGIGGSVAEIVGKKLTQLSSYHQVICITHLPQIAKFGDHHFTISKQVSDGRTKTVITPVKHAERVNEIAKMLGGETITQTTLAHAREMLNLKDGGGK